MPNKSRLSASVDVAIQFYHLDPMEIVWHGNYPRFLEKARCALLDKIGYNYEEMRASGYAWPIVDMRIKYVKSVSFKQIITITAELVEYENRMVIDYKISDRENGEILTKAQTKMVALDIIKNEMQFESPRIFVDKVEALL
ncbi:acyl-CoA thioesterase [Sneathiella glossodoripedis]|uniref:acyl-CoA thioesterase n=1 Tax=Sneathiella glossodoripedis TaxID=418853 RepID=UPI00046FC7C8|nr:acyl-CoA thioesterase [Sneathiella glossodoripedis]